MEQIRIRGARTHNLKNVNLDLPRHKLVVITGLSGSGKSSLAFDTLYAEGQRRYVESLSAYARQFLQLMEKPDVDLIEGLSPAISIEQKATSHNPRSTVGTVTEIHDYLRLLFARVGTPYCPDHEIPLEAQSVSQMVDAALALPEETRLMILAPVVADRKGEHVELFEEMQAQGFIRFRVRSGGGTANEGVAKIYEVDSLPKLKKNDKHTIDVVDRPSESAAGHEAAARRIVRNGAASRRRPRDRARNGYGQGEAVQLEVRVPDLLVFAAGTGAAPLLVQQPDGRVPGMRRPRPDHVLRSEAGGRASVAVARGGRGEGLGPAQPVLLPDAAKSRGVLRIRHRHRRRRPAGEGPQDSAVRLGQAGDSVLVHQRTRPHLGARACVRRDHPESGAALSRDRFGRGARRTRQVSEQPAVPGLRRHAAAPRSALRADRRGRRRARHLRNQRLAVARRARLFPDAAARRLEARDRRQGREGNRRASDVPE